MLLVCKTSFLCFRCRVAPVGVFAIAWLGTKDYCRNVLNKIRGRIAGLAHRAKVRLAALAQRAKHCRRRRPDRATSGHEMKSELRTDADDLKRSLMA
jgi:hypothetical protein